MREKKARENRAKLFSGYLLSAICVRKGGGNLGANAAAFFTFPIASFMHTAKP